MGDTDGSLVGALIGGWLVVGRYRAAEGRRRKWVYVLVHEDGRLRRMKGRRVLRLAHREHQAGRLVAMPVDGRWRRPDETVRVTPRTSTDADWCGDDEQGVA